VFALEKGKGGPVSQESQSESSGHGGKEFSAGEINGCIFPTELGSPIRRRKRWKADCPLRADISTGSALNTLGETYLLRVLIHSTHGAGLLTFQAFIALRADPTFKKAKGGEETEECTQGAKVSAPEAGSQAIQKNDSRKDEES
jgi:hypothetical protein